MLSAFAGIAGRGWSGSAKWAANMLRAAGSDRGDDLRPLAGRTVVLNDDVLTSGSAAEACAKALREAEARRVELICWARVVRPARIMRLGRQKDGKGEPSAESRDLY